MSNTYTQLHIQFVFAVKFRRALIHADWQERLHQYITGIVQGNRHKLLQINSMPDHIHLLVGLRPHQAISALMQVVKSESTKWVKEQGFCKQNFAWQEGYGAFSYSPQDVPTVIRYIQNQQTHHRQENFLDEYRCLLKEHDIAFEEAYIFRNPE